MIKKTITYTDFNNETRTEDFYFNLSIAELTDWEFGVEGGMSNLIDKIVNEKDATKLYGLFKDIVKRSYGKKSPDGRRFIKNNEDYEAFASSPAYDELIMSLLSDADAAAKFVNGVLPTKAIKQRLAASNNLQVMG